MDCEVKALLASSYSSALSDYERSVKVLSTSSKAMSKEQYENLRIFAEKAKRRADRERAELNAHIAQHGC